MVPTRELEPARERLQVQPQEQWQVHWWQQQRQEVQEPRRPWLQGQEPPYPFLCS